MQWLPVKQNDKKWLMRWQMKSKPFGPSSEAPLDLLHVVGVLQRKRARPPPASFSHLLVLFFWSCQTFIWSSHSSLNLGQTCPHLGQLPSQGLEGLKVNFPAYLNGSRKQNISIDVHLLSYSLPENSWLLQEIFIYRKFVLCDFPPFPVY